MAFDFRGLLTVSKAERAPLQREHEDAEWARYGRNLYSLIESDRFLKAVNTALLQAEPMNNPAPDIVRRIRVYLATGTIAS